jgi:hypothetical protein
MQKNPPCPVAELEFLAEAWQAAPGAGGLGCGNWYRIEGQGSSSFLKEGTKKPLPLSLRGYAAGSVHLQASKSFLVLLIKKELLGVVCLTF